MKGIALFASVVFVVVGCSSPKSGASAASDPYVRAKALGLYTDLTYLSQRSVPEGTDAAPLYEEFGFNYTWETRNPLLEYLRGESDRDAVATILDGLDFPGVEKIASRPNFVLNRDWSKTMEWLLPEISQSRDMTRALCARALYRVQDGRTSEAAHDFRRIATLQEHMSQYGMSLSQLTRISNLAIVAITTEQIANELVSQPEELQLILDELAAIAEPEDFDTIRSEIAFAISSFRYVRRGDMSLDTFTDTSLSGSITPPNPFDVARIESHGDDIERYLVSLFVRCAEVWQDREQLAATYQDIQDELGAKGSGYGETLAKIVALVVLPFLDSHQEVEDKQRAHLRSMSIGVAATIMRARNGEWPTLAEAAEYGGTSLDDPFGKRLRYKADGARLLVYSVGPDGIDGDGARRHTGQTGRDAFDTAVFEVIVR
ncbi:MAG: hypothetical protein IH944_03460 [Armatimonadetes bacterium]|nr:hypothetical protein [Armatimonadota bacterium]